MTRLFVGATRSIVWRSWLIADDMPIRSRGSRHFDCAVPRPRASASTSQRALRHQDKPVGLERLLDEIIGAGRIADTAVSILPWPEIVTTGRLGCMTLISSSNARPSSRDPCSQMSRKTSGAHDPLSSRARYRRRGPCAFRDLHRSIYPRRVRECLLRRRRLEYQRALLTFSVSRCFPEGISLGFVSSSARPVGEGKGSPLLPCRHETPRAHREVPTCRHGPRRSS